MDESIGKHNKNCICVYVSVSLVSDKWIRVLKVNYIFVDKETVHVGEDHMYYSYAANEAKIQLNDLWDYINLAYNTKCAKLYQEFQVQWTWPSEIDARYHNSSIDGWLFWGFTALSAVLQLYRADEG